MSYGIESTLESIERHLVADVFLAVPSLVLSRALIEYAASAAWILDSKVTTDMRHARGSALTLRSVERAIEDLGTGANPSPDVARTRRVRDELLAHLKEGGAVVTPRTNPKTGEVLAATKSVAFGAARAPVMFNISQRIREYIPLDGVYSTLSGVAHGEQIILATAAQHPETQLRAVAMSAFRATEAWSRSVCLYVGADTGPFINGSDYRALIESVPLAIRTAVDNQSAATPGAEAQ